VKVILMNCRKNNCCKRLAASRCKVNLLKASETLILFWVPPCSRMCYPCYYLLSTIKVNTYVSIYFDISGFIIFPINNMLPVVLSFIQKIKGWSALKTLISDEGRIAVIFITTAVAAAASVPFSST